MSMDIHERGSNGYNATPDKISKNRTTLNSSKLND